VNTEFKFCNTPNQHANPPSLEVCIDGVLFHGYQEFFLSGVNHAVVPKDDKLKVKHELLTPYFKPKFLAKRTFLDLGANAAFYSFWALSEGAEKAIAVDIDEIYLNIVNKAANLLSINELDTFQSNIADWEQPADVVLALALVHWIYSCSALFGSLDAIVAKLSQLTNCILIIEWVAPEDEAIRYFHHLSWNQNGITEAYTVEAFECALAKYFSHYQKIGDVSPSRSLYVAFCSAREIDLSVPLPIVKQKANIISSRLLAINKGAEYWSVVYDDGSLIYKQTSYDLALREAQFLKQLAGSEYFPAVKDLLRHSEFSLVAMEKVEGTPLGQIDSDLFANPEFVYDFIGHCLNLLSELKDKGITHRDIHNDNLIVRNGKPVLIDFGWAVSAEYPYFIPNGLGLTFRPPDGGFCDVYSMGQVLKNLISTPNIGINFILKLMTFPESELRQTDIRFLRTLLELAKEMDFDNTREKMKSKVMKSNISVQDVHLLLQQLNRYAEKINWLDSELLRQRELNSYTQSLSQGLTEDNSRLNAGLSQALANLNAHVIQVRGGSQSLSSLEARLNGMDPGLEKLTVQIVSLINTISERDSEIVRLNQAMVELDAQIQNKSQSVSSLKARLNGMNQGLEKLTGHIVSLINTASERESEIVRLKQAMGELHALITQIRVGSQSLSSLEARLDGMDPGLENLAVQIRSLIRTANERDEEIVKLNQVISELDLQVAQIRDGSQSLSSLEARLDGMDPGLESLAAQILSLIRTANERDEEIVKLNQVISELDLQVAQIRAGSQSLSSLEARLDGMDPGLENLAAQILSLIRTANERDEEIVKLNQVISELDLQVAQIRAGSQSLDHLEARLNELDPGLEKLTTQIVSLIETANGQDCEIARLTHTFDNWKNQIFNLHDLLGKRNEANFKVQSELKELDHIEVEINELNPYFENLAIGISDLMQLVSDRDKQIADLTNETVLRGNWALGLDAELKQVRERLDGITFSNSWRMTMPLREMTRWLKSPSHQLERYYIIILTKSKRLYHRLPLSDDTKLKHYQFLAKFAPRLLAATQDESLGTSLVLQESKSAETESADRTYQAPDHSGKEDGSVISLANSAKSGQLSVHSYLVPFLRLAKKFYQKLPLSIESKFKHRLFLTKLFPRIMEASGTYPAIVPSIQIDSPIIHLDQCSDSADSIIGLLTIARSLIFPVYSSPVVSVIIPVYGKIDYTISCLDSILKHLPLTTFEVIIVDDCSPDRTFEILSNVGGIRLVQNEKNSGFILSCNNGAEVASGKFLYFLNNDTQVTSGWMDELVRTFDEFPGTGLAGSKLVYPDGRLQEAGGIIWRDGSAWNFGRYQDPLLPIYCYAREVDYCSGASIMVPKSLFDELGGFDTEYVPAYCEDSDLALKIRAKGYRVIYQPMSAVIHFEGGTSGTDETQGIKKHQIQNSKKLFSRWKDHLNAHQISGQDVDKAKDRASTFRVLVIDHCTPTPDQDAGSVTVFNNLLLLREMKFQVTFIAESNFLYMPDYTTILQRLGIEVLYAPYVTSVMQHLEEFGDRYNLIYLFRPGVFEQHEKSIRKHCPDAKLLYHTVDLHFLRMAREAELLSDKNIQRAASKMQESELKHIRNADASIVHSSVELDILKQLVPESKLHVFPLILDIKDSIHPFLDRKDIVFVGGYQHPPNVDAVKYFAADVMPLLREKLPGVQFYVVGSKPPVDLNEIASNDIVITGYVSELTSLLDKMRVSVAPLRYGAGIKGKIGSAMVVGLPVVATSLAVEGMSLTHGENILVADGAEAIADSIAKIYLDETLWNRISTNGLIFARKTWGPEPSWATLAAILASLDIDVERSHYPLLLYSPPQPTNTGDYLLQPVGTVSNK
jgi:GT2 family glycosyltransferase/glycosyltransferase involved in cell wall biosynthesis/serine/threonine protein kinase